MNQITYEKVDDVTLRAITPVNIDIPTIKKQIADIQDMKTQALAGHDSQISQNIIDAQAKKDTIDANYNSTIKALDAKIAVLQVTIDAATSVGIL